MDEGFPPEIEVFRSIVMKITKLQLQQIIREEIIDWQGKYNDDFKFKVGTIVKDINPDCPHQGSEGIVTKTTPDEVTYTVSNNGKNYKIGNILTKTKDQLTPLKLEELVTESGILYRAGVKKYGKEGMRKIQQAAGKRKSHAVIGKIKDKYEKKKKESVANKDCCDNCRQGKECCSNDV